MKNICFYFQVHQPYRLKLYRFFEVGKDHYYYDDYLNKHIFNKVASRSYLPMNALMLRLLNDFPDFKVTFSLTGIFMDQMERFSPALLKSFQDLAQTGQVEFLAETYAHSMAALRSDDEFAEQVARHSEKIAELFGCQTRVFRNSELVYSDIIGEKVAKLGFKSMLAEGAKHVLGWKSPNYLYYNVNNPKLKILLRNFKLSDDIAFRFSNRGWSQWPLTADKYIQWLNGIGPSEEFVNLFMDYETFGEHQPLESGVYDFFEDLVRKLHENPNYGFMTPSQITDGFQPVAPASVPFPSSWADEERDLSAWLGNEMQKEAFNKLYNLRDLVIEANDPELLIDWNYLQASDHFYYMCTKFFSDGAVHHYFNPYNNPYDAFINYMNVLSDFILRLEKRVQRIRYQGIPVDELSESQIQEAIETYEKTLKRLKKKKTKIQKDNLKSR